MEGVASIEISSPDTAIARPFPRRGLVFGIVSMALLMASVDASIVATALPAIQHELGARVNWAGWTITIYALGQVLTMPVAGRISDQFGRKKVFVGAAMLFTAASLACGFAGNIAVLVVLRAIQAIGGGAFMPSATGIVADHFGPGRDRAIGMFTSILPLGGIIGPVFGGVFVTFWSWRGIFLVNVPIGIALTALAVAFIPADTPRPAGRVDVRGVALLGAMVLASMLGITYLGSGEVAVYDPVFLACEAVALVAAVLFVRHAKHHERPFIPIRLMRGRGFGVMNLINLCFGAAAIGVGALVPLYAEERFAITSLEAGTLLTARAVGSVCVAALAVFSMRRIGHRWPMLIGFSVTAAGFAAMYTAPGNISPYLWLSIAAGITGIGMGMTVPATNNASLQLAPDQAASIAGLRGMFRQSGAIIAISVTTAILARSQDPGAVHADLLLAFAALLILILPLLFLVPDHRGRW